VSLVCAARSVRERGGARATLDHYLRAAPDYHARHGRFPEEAAVRAVSPITHHVRSSVAPGVALVGDAAGFLDPLTGEGIYQALFGARALSASLTAASSFAPGELEQALRRYSRARGRGLSLKRHLNQYFQAVIRRPDQVERLARALAGSTRRADAFLGTIGNVYGPVEGLVRTLRP
jgi:flavin-dependent dehydrogenase